MNSEEAHKLTKDAAFRLAEHFNSVQILCSLTDESGTLGVKAGCGDWYSRQGLAHEFITDEVASENAKHIASALHPED